MSLCHSEQAAIPDAFSCWGDRCIRRLYAERQGPKPFVDARPHEPAGQPQEATSRGELDLTCLSSGAMPLDQRECPV